MKKLVAKNLYTEKELALLNRICRVAFIDKQSKSRRTGSLIVVVEKPMPKTTARLQIKLHHGIGRWLVVCVTHSQAKPFHNKVVAYKASSATEDFCEGCKSFLSAEGTSIHFGY